MTQSCMGSFRCLKRDTCAHYHAASESQEPAQKLCEPGQYGAYIAINLHKVVEPQPAKEPA